MNLIATFRHSIYGFNDHPAFNCSQITKNTSKSFSWYSTLRNKPYAKAPYSASKAFASTSTYKAICKLLSEAIPALFIENQVAGLEAVIFPCAGSIETSSKKLPHENTLFPGGQCTAQLPLS